MALLYKRYLYSTAGKDVQSCYRSIITPVNIIGDPDNLKTYHNTLYITYTKRFHQAQATGLTPSHAWDILAQVSNVTFR